MSIWEVLAGWLRSRTILSGILAVLGGVLSVLFRMDSELVQAIKDSTTEVLAGFAAVLGGIGSIIFRIRASRNLNPASTDSDLRRV
jgi:ABC-type nitrate/sulfonate/bicarbonate transport system permease component